MSEMSMEVDGTQLPLDEDGFLQQPDLWNERVAQAFAGPEGIEGELTEEHWKVIHYLREYYLANDIAPMVRRLCKETGFNVKKIYQLFPNGPAKGACKLAGLPKPTGCV